MPSRADRFERVVAVVYPVRVGKTQTFRFAAGTPERPTSSVWNVVTAVNKPDVYLGPQQALGIMKLSLHEKEWRLATTSQSGAVFPHTGSRLGERWDPQTEITPGWIAGPALVILDPGDHEPFPYAPVKERRISWVPGPAAGHRLIFGLYMEMTGARGEAPVPDYAVRLGHVEFGGGRVWVYHAEEPIPQEDRDYATYMLSDPRIGSSTVIGASVIAIDTNSCHLEKSLITL